VEHRNDARLRLLGSEHAAGPGAARYDLLGHFIRGKPVADLEAASRQAQSASEQLNELRWQAQFAAMPPERQAKWERIAAGEHVPLPDEPDPSPCPEWCDEPAHLPERVGLDHVGASASVSGALSPPHCLKTAATFVYLDDGRGLVYVAEGDYTPQQARQLAAGLLKAADLAQRIRSAQP